MSCTFAERNLLDGGIFRTKTVVCERTEHCGIHNYQFLLSGENHTIIGVVKRPLETLGTLFFDFNQILTEFFQ